MESSEAILANETTNGAPRGSGDGSVESQAMHLIAERKFEDAVQLLEPVVATDPSGNLHGWLGTALLYLNRFEAAAEQFALAQKGSPPKSERARDLEYSHETAISNSMSKSNEDIPFGEKWSAESLIAPPPLPSGLPNGPVHSPAPRTALGALLAEVSRLAGVTVGAVSSALAPLADSIGPHDPVWTTWYRKPTFLALLTLLRAREALDRRNLVDTYPAGELTAFLTRGLRPPPGVKYFRTVDGSWNNLDNPKEGAANVRFPRNISRATTWPRKTALLSPNPAEVAQVLLGRGNRPVKEVPFLNLLAAAWIQFNIHDWVSHRMGVVYEGANIFEIPLPADHPARQRYRQTKMYVARTEPDLSRSAKDDGTPPTYINEVTSWWDASQIYGSDEETAKRLRAFRRGELKLDPTGRLPTDNHGLDDVGYNRNWWLGLSLMHTLFVKEHNSICAMLATAYPGWDDSTLYNVARLINAAVIAKIHTVEWTPAILPNPTLNMAMNANWSGLLDTTLNRRTGRTALPWYKIRDPQVGGIVGNPIDKHGEPYGLSEEFTEVYRLHELLPDAFVLRRLGDPSSVKSVPLARARQAAVRGLTQEFEMADLFFSFGNQSPGQLVLNNYPEALRTLNIPGNPVYDLAAVDILRARERGVPRYNEFRRQFGLRPIREFEDLTSDPVQLAAMRRVYDNDVEAIDLLVGTRAESHRPTGYGFGETMFQVFILNASRRLQADRFYTDSFNAETYTPEGLAWIDKADMKSVLVRHYPELLWTGLANVDNAFEPWDTGKLDPARHPLREFA
jgi:hypothetical protein